MEPQKPQNNCCSKHPSQRKKFVCTTCEKIYCYTCSEEDDDHSANIKFISKQLLESFEFNQYLGAGAYGCVFGVTSLSDHFPYALKVISDIKTEEDFNIVSKEAQLHATMVHPNIIKYHSSFRVKKESLFVVILELADSSLATEIESLSKSTAFYYFTQILEALRYLHDDLKIAHRDLKPKNILVKSGIVKLCDMGDAKILKKKMLTLSSSKGFGTRIYLPPEVLNGNNYNEKSDIWAAGIAFHKMLSKWKHPFNFKENNDEDEIVKNVKNQNIKIDEFIQEEKYLTILESLMKF